MFMRILYGVCGEGLGHSSRAESVIKHLKKSGHEVLVLTYGHAYSALKKFDPVDIFGIELEYIEGNMSVWRSYFSNLKKFYGRLKDFPLIKKKVSEFSPELCISDMEPIVPIISFWYKLPLISIDNQHALVFSKMSIPLKYKKAFYVARGFVKRCISRAHHFIVLSFVKEDVGRKNVSYVNPILRQEVVKMKPVSGDFVLVYLSNRDDRLEGVLRGLNEKFVVYGGSLEGGRVKNVLYKKKGKGFLLDLKKCKGVVATSGFSLMSEALYLKKPYFAIPLKGQFEQFANALYLKKSGFGEYSEEPSVEDLKGFFSRLKEFRRKLRRYKSDSSEALRVLDGVIGELSSASR
jgi:uncharacterized protein (TIGR00661 family)